MARNLIKRVLEALITSGAMDEFGGPEEDLNAIRARLRATLPLALHSARATGQ